MGQSEALGIHHCLLDTYHGHVLESLKNIHGVKGRHSIGREGDMIVKRETKVLQDCCLKMYESKWKGGGRRLSMEVT